MLEDSFPTFRFRPSSDTPLVTLVHHTHNGSAPQVAYLLERAAASPNRYALGLVDAHCTAILYGEVVVPLPSATTTTTTPPPPPPSSIAITLHNPSQTVRLRLQRSSFKSDAWTFSVPTTTTSSSFDQTPVPPRVHFRWKRDSRLTRDMTCYMTGTGTGTGTGTDASSEPDITVAMFRAGRRSDDQGRVVVYEPNMARVDVDDRKGLEVVVLLGAAALRHLYRVPRADTTTTTKEDALVAAEQHRIRLMLEREEADRIAAIDAETARLRRQYGVEETPPLPPRPSSAAGTESESAAQHQHHQHGRAYKLGNALGMLLHGKDDKNDKVAKKRSVYF